VSGESNDDGHARMAERGKPEDPGSASSSNGFARELTGRLLLGGLGAVALTAERVDALVDALVSRGGLQRDQARSVVDEVTSRWRADSGRFGRASAGAQGILRELGVVTRSELEDLELRLAQLEHRLRLLETRANPPRTSG
jgi:polyhydroxyalkanoate synthesis regulator phasin